MGAEGRLSAHSRRRESKERRRGSSSPTPTRCSTRIIEKNLLTARGVYGFFPANAVGDDVELYADGTRAEVLERFHFLRQQANREGSEPCRSLADFIAPKETGLRDTSARSR